MNAKKLRNLRRKYIVQECILLSEEFELEVALMKDAPGMMVEH